MRMHLSSNHKAAGSILAASAVLALAGTSVGQSMGGAGVAVGSTLPSTIQLTGVVRDFKEKSVSGGHPDFERKPTAGFGHYSYMVADDLDSEGKPVMATSGLRVNSNWKDSAGRNVMPPRPHAPAPVGGTIGSVSTSEGGALTSCESFGQWFRDVNGVNMSMPLTLTLNRQQGTNIYTFDDKTDPLYSSNGGFFPVNGELFGNSANNNKNFHFTFELDTEFVYRKNTGQVFKFTGDDDVWVFVDGKCVIDIGGVHGAVEQSVDLDRLSWLVDGKTYSLKFFFAERHRTQSNFRIETSLVLKDAQLPVVSGVYD